MSTPQTFDNVIAGKPVSAENYRENINPSDTSDVIGRFASATAADVDAAVAAAQAAQPEWAAASPQVRFTVLSRAARIVEDRADELADLLAREEGKPIGEAKGEVLRASQLFDFFAAEAVRNKGEVLDSVRPGMQVRMTREPVGVIGIVTPWNFPIAIPTWKIAPALAFGNAVVFKPADLTPGCAWHLVDILSEAGLPDGVLNLVMGRGSVVGQAITEHPGVGAVSFTGSRGVGSALARDAAAAGKRVQCEMGGKNPLVVLDDADLDVAVEAAVNGAYFSTGQRCTASSRLIVTAGVHDEFVSRMKARLAELTVGDARDEKTIVGPVVDEGQLKNDVDYIEVARSEGGTVHGGERIEEIDGKTGFFLSPALITDTTNDMRINQEEVFGPVASVIRVADYEEALAVANDVEFGLSSGICTTSLAKAEHFLRHSDAGMVIVNAPTAGVDPHASFGGRKGSSYGYREQGEAAREFYTLHKTAYINPLV